MAGEIAATGGGVPAPAWEPCAGLSGPGSRSEHAVQTSASAAHAKKTLLGVFDPTPAIYRKGHVMPTPCRYNSAMIGITLDELADFPARLARTFSAIPQKHRNWTPASWDGIPSEQFSALGQI